MNNFPKLLAICLLLICSSLSAKNIELAINESSCKKIDGYGPNDKMSIASTFRVSMSSINFLGARWMPGRYGIQECLMIFDTAAGPKKCSISSILSDDGGKTAFAVVDRFNVGKANTCY